MRRGDQRGHIRTFGRLLSDKRLDGARDLEACLNPSARSEPQSCRAMNGRKYRRVVSRELRLGTSCSGSRQLNEASAQDIAAAYPIGPNSGHAAEHEGIGRPDGTPFGLERHRAGLSERVGYRQRPTRPDASPRAPNRLLSRILRSLPFSRILQADAGTDERSRSSGTNSADLRREQLPRGPVALVMGEPLCPDPFNTVPISRDEGEILLAELIAPLCGERAASIAFSLIQHYGSLPALLRSSRLALTHQLPDEPDLVILLSAVQPLVRQLLLTELLDSPVLTDSRAALDYLFVRLSHELTEQVYALYLDAKNRVIAHELIARGSVSKVDLFPREIIRRALELGSTGLILAHNHPSGDPTPSQSDFNATRAVADAARLFDIVLHDHIVVGRAGWRSLRDDGFL